MNGSLDPATAANGAYTYSVSGTTPLSGSVIADNR